MPKKRERGETKAHNIVPVAPEPQRLLALASTTGGMKRVSLLLLLLLIYRLYGGVEGLLTVEAHGHERLDACQQQKKVKVSRSAEV